MVVPSNRSSSPITPKPNNPNPSQSLRRSFSGTSSTRPSIVTTNPRSLNPTTPVNSPADFGRSMVIQRGFDEKENDKAAKFRSPAKISKNFMSPTISAASKFTPSPRKKVLVERTDLIRTSMTLFDGKATFFSANPSDGSENIDETSASEGNLVPKPVKKVTFKEVTIDDSHDSTESDCDNIELSSNIKPYCSSIETLSDKVDVELCLKDKPSPCLSNFSPIIAPLDADPSFPPPYDPKTNYLSPRPQFLRYKPNPRIELLQNKENGIDFGEFDDIMCEMSSNLLDDSENTEEDSVQESDEASSAEMAAESEEGSETDERLEKEIEMVPVTTTMVDEVFEEMPRRKSSIVRWKSISMLMVILIACISIFTVMNSPAMDSSVLNNVNFKLYVPSEVSTFVKVKVDGFIERSKQWSENLVHSEVSTFVKVNFDGFFEILFEKSKQCSENLMSYLLELIPVIDEVETFGPLQFYNLTPIQDNSLQFFEVDTRRSQVYDEKLAQEVVLEVEDEEEEVVVEATEEVVEAEIDEWDENYINEVEIVDEPEIREVLVSSESVSDLNSESESLKSSEDNLVSSSEIEKSETLQVVEDHLVSASEIEMNIADTEILPSISIDNVEILEEEDSDDKIEVYNVVMVLIPLVLAGFGLLMYWKYVKTSTNVMFDKNKVKIAESSVPEEKTYSQNWPNEESCPDEMSSYVQGSYSNERKKKNKRESLASSSASEFSMGSPSYGSFTTYERIPIKANRDEEMVTPVRRSSRLRTQQVVASPQL